MKLLSLAAAALALLVASCASTRAPEDRRTLAGPDQRMSDRLDLFQRHAGPPVDKFHFWDMKRFEVLGEHQLAVWTTIDDAYLITVMRPCVGLEFADAVSLSSTHRQVYQRFDTVNFDEQRCRIREIRPVDGDALDDRERVAGG